MKKKIIIGFTMLGIIFMLGGVYIVVAIERGTSTLDKLIMLHQVEILREHLLIQVKRVESDLSLRNTRHARGADVIMADVRNMGVVADQCFKCHHRGEVREQLVALKGSIDNYRAAVSRVLTIEANSDRLKPEEDRAYEMGEDLIKRISSMIAFTTMRLDERTNSSLSQISSAKSLLYAFMVSQVFIAIALAYLFIRSVTKPAASLLEATRRLKSGDLDFRVEGLRDEFGEVASSFNEMSRALKKHMQEKHKAEQMKMVGMMAAGLAHEIKNPLAGIKVSIEVLSEDSSLSEDDRSVMSGVIKEIRRIEVLIKGLLEFARPSKPQFRFVNVASVLDNAIKFSLKPRSSNGSANGIKIVKEYDESLPEIVADPIQMQQVFMNLFLNASAAMPDGGSLTVRAASDYENGTLEVVVSDTGKGISEKDMVKIFEPFFTTRSKGTGLGLAVSKQLIEQHGGTIAAETNAAGGATFRVVLPASQVEEVQTV
jgi:signal transduction histidine kinase